LNILGERISQRRKQKGLTQDELAKKAYISKQVISNIERGKTSVVSETVLNLLSYALLTTTDFLSGESDEPDKNRNGLIVPMYILPPWDYDYEIKELMNAHSKNRKVERIIRDIVNYLTYANCDDHGVEILENLIKLIRKEDHKTLEILMKFVKSLNE
jgi:transcriptional regulator with XRE-family HTH domain